MTQQTVARKIRILITAVPLLGTVLMVVPRASAPPGHGKHDAALEDSLQRGEDGWQRVIVRAVPGQRSALAAHLLSKRDHKVHGEHELIDAITVDMPIAAIRALEHRPFVASVSLDAPLEAAQGSTSQPGPPAGYLLRPALGLDSKSPQGAGVTVAVIDSGIEPSSDFGTRIKAFYDFTRGGIAVKPYDDYGHGTHVAGLIGGSGAQSNGTYAGVAPKVNLIGMKVLDVTGSGVTSNVIAALQFATQQKAALGIDVINLSLGHPVFEPAATDPLVEAVQKAAAAGIVVVVSAGNCGVNPATGVPGFGGVLSPGNAPAALTVGSINLNATKKRSDDVVNNYSSRGPTWYDGFAKPDIVAPGYHLIAPAAQGRTLAAMYPSLLVNSTYMTLSGTSMAAAVVSGVVAQVIEANRGGIRGDQAPLSPNAVKAILEFTALTLNDPVTLTPYSALIQGAGGVNAHGAIALARSIDTRKPKGSTWLAAAVNPYSTIDEVLVWAQNILWGNGILWGDTIYVNRDSWGTGILWGDNVLWGDGILWGDNILWGNGAPWRDNLVFGSSLANANSVSMTDPAFANSIPMLNDDVLNR